MSYDVGNYPVSTMFSYEIISDGKPHRIELLAFGKNFTLRVDDGISRSIVNEGAKEYLTTNSPLYVAGTPDKVAERALKQWHLRNVTSFNGEGIASFFYFCLDKLDTSTLVLSITNFLGREHEQTTVINM